MLPLRDNVPTRSFPVVTVGLIVANFIVWFWELSGRGVDYHVLQDGYYPCSLSGPCGPPASSVHHLPWYDGAFTSMFMHASWEHILGNMLFLWIFGNNVEDALGRVRFFVWYIVGGLAATTLQTVVTLHYSGVYGASVPNIGASGAISAVLGGYLVMLPNAKVLTWIFVIIREIPAIWFLGIWFLFQLFDGGYAIRHPEAGGGVAFFAHVGGFVFGAATVYLVAKRRPLRPAY
jgi:membrane associated rhomboid family serine protease